MRQLKRFPGIQTLLETGAQALAPDSLLHQAVGETVPGGLLLVRQTAPDFDAASFARPPSVTLSPTWRGVDQSR